VALLTSSAICACSFGVIHDMDSGFQRANRIGKTAPGLLMMDVHYIYAMSLAVVRQE